MCTCVFNFFFVFVCVFFFVAQQTYSQHAELTLGFWVQFSVYCDYRLIRLDLQCPADKWCGIVWNEFMVGDALVWYQKPGTEEPWLYDMNIEQRYAVPTLDTTNNWVLISRTVVDGVNEIVAVRSWNRSFVSLSLSLSLFVSLCLLCCFCVCVWFVSFKVLAHLHLGRFLSL